MAVPVPENSLDLDENGRISTNELFAQLNHILHGNIHHEIKGSSVEIGDKFESNSGNLQIQVQKFDTSNGFPVTFRPSDDTIIDDIEVIPAGGDLEGASNYIINNNKREDTDSSTDNQEADSTTSKIDENSTCLLTTSVKSIEKTAQTSTTETSLKTTVKS